MNKNPINYYIFSKNLSHAYLSIIGK